jgi:hypothetical protein
MAGVPAETDAPVWPAAEVTAVEPLAVEVDEATADRALASHAPAPSLERLIARLRAALCAPFRSTSRG